MLYITLSSKKNLNFIKIRLVQNCFLLVSDYIDL